MFFSKIVRKPSLFVPITLIPSIYAFYKYGYVNSASERFLRTFKMGLSNTFDYKYSLFGMVVDTKHYNLAMDMCHQRCAERMLDCCLKNGGIYVKLGQGLSALNHILPKEYIKTLTPLHDKALFSTYDDVIRVFEEDMGRRPEEVFRSFETKPFAAASLAQVHRAVGPKGEKLAVKVQYYDLQKRFYSDTSTLEFLLKWAEKLNPNFGFAWILQDLKGTLEQELDFEIERSNSERCAEHLKKFKDVHVPKAYKRFSTKRILSMEYIDGVKISDIEMLEKWNINFKWLDKLLIRSFSHQIFHTGFVHGDPHPGNIMVRLTEPLGRPQLVILDHGLYETMGLEQMEYLAGLIRSLIHKDFVNTKLYSESLGVEDWQTLGEIVLQHPIDTKEQKKFKMMNSRLTADDLEYMRLKAAEHFDKIIAVLRSLPKPMLLFIRNLNITRSVCKQHGDVVNRYVYLTESAIKARHRSLLKNNVVLTKLSMYWEIASFRFIIKFNSFCEKVTMAFLRFINFLGIGPPVDEIQEIYLQELAEKFM